MIVVLPKRKNLKFNLDVFNQIITGNKNENHFLMIEVSAPTCVYLGYPTSYPHGNRVRKMEGNNPRPFLPVLGFEPDLMVLLHLITTDHALGYAKQGKSKRSMMCAMLPFKHP